MASLLEPAAAKVVPRSTPLGMSDLPVHLWRRICFLLPLSSIGKFSRASHFTHAIATDDTLWQELCARAGLFESPGIAVPSYLNLYQELLLVNERWRAGEFKISLLNAGGGAWFCVNGNCIMFKLGESIHIVDMPTKQLQARIDFTTDYGIRFMQHDPYTNQLLRVGAKSSVHVHDARNGATLFSLPSGGLQVSQIHLLKQFLYILWRNKSKKSLQLDVWNITEKKLVHSITPRYRCRFVIDEPLLLVSEPSETNVYRLGTFQLVEQIPMPTVRSTKHLTANAKKIVRVAKMRRGSYQIQVFNAKQRSLEWTVYVSEPVMRLRVDSWRLIVGFQNYVRVWDIKSRSVLFHLSPDPVKQFPQLRAPIVRNLVGGKTEFFSLFAGTCLHFEARRLFVKYPSNSDIVVYDFSLEQSQAPISKSLESMPSGSPLSASALDSYAYDSDEEVSGSTIQMEYGEVAKKSALLDDFAVDFSLDPEFY